MNSYEIEEELKGLRKRVEVMEQDLKKFAVELSATSQVAIITRIAIMQQDIKEYESMLDVIKFDEIIDGEFK